MRKAIEVTKDAEDEIPFEVMERSIVEIGQAMARISKTRVSRKLIVALIQDDIKVGKGLIETVLNSLDMLEKRYLKPKAPTK